MARKGWHILKDEGRVTVTRRLPVRFDLSVEAELPCARTVSLTRVAQQVRQDMWRRLQDLRGFAPAVEVSRSEGGLVIRAGGALADPVTGRVRDSLADLLESPTHQARWIAHAGRRSHG
ncbi:hypothetical protein SAMN06297129_1023 [Pseudooceanicola antarcticus]|uniref:Uncharacterized protein n=1 Tax=Pseudooceanicola antarcticus TaxID=1247613 RepID=A0A285IFK1_9RHOB|nr:hypothetical protein [Pseudooceanicola antarcticus]PJE29099.1 hypothetical protein CVM39_11715 [Pseudooceanicola antarcticus]SNY46745.1 hypothetical protein SAMN06297129_1023 [Pseudooceanicola antarcticus]